MSLLLAMMLQAVVASPPVDTTALQAQLQAAQTAAADAKTAADAAAATAAAAASTASTATTTANAAVSRADALTTAMTSTVKTVNGISPTNGAVSVLLPTASTVMPPCISDAGAPGTAGTMVFAPWNHTHCSKARRLIATSAADGSYTYDYSAAPFTNPPVCSAVAEVAAGITDIINVQIVGTPTISSAKFLVNRTQKSVASLLNLTVLSVPAQPGATRLHMICLEP
jgi:hypothetical protein